MRNRSRGLMLALVLSTTTLGLAPSAFAQSSADKATARQLGIQGDDALSKKDFKTAEDKFTRADALYHAPTLSLGLARAQAANGKLVAAQENYNRIIREGAPAGSPQAFVQAVESAQKEVDAVSARIAHVTITVSGTEGVDPTVTLDAQPVPVAALGVQRPVDPGAHVVKATAQGYKPGETSFTVADAAQATATIALEKDPNAAVASTALAPAAGTTEPPKEPQDDKGKPYRIAGYAALGVGAAGVVVGSVFGVMALSSHGSLSDDCQNGTCPSNKSDDVSSYHTKGMVSTIGFIVGGVGLAAGAALILLAPKAHTEIQIGKGTYITPVFGPTNAGIVGRF